MLRWFRKIANNKMIKQSIDLRDDSFREVVCNYYDSNLTTAQLSRIKLPIVRIYGIIKDVDKAVFTCFISVLNSRNEVINCGFDHSKGFEKFNKGDGVDVVGKIRFSAFGSVLAMDNCVLINHTYKD